MFNKHDISRDACQLFGEQARCGYDRRRHSFTDRREKTGRIRADHAGCEYGEYDA